MVGEGTILTGLKGKTIHGQYYRDEIVAKVYAPALNKPGLFPDPTKAIFQQDGATPHTAKVTQDYCTTIFPTVWSKSEWPGQSPDLNPIEKLWSILKEEVFQPPFCKTLDQLITRVQRPWENIPQETLSGIVHRYWPDRVSSVIDHQGENNFR